MSNRPPALAALLLLITLSRAIGAPLELGLPIDCAIGQDCFVQQYLDQDPSDGAHDYACGTATYDGHKGTDIRLIDTAAADAGVAVIASAPGTVKAIRDGVADRLIKSPEDRQQIAGRECGNGVVIDHGRGWETQYCHMRNGSVLVRQGDPVEAGTRLGEVGYSGDAQFAHVHLSVRLNGGEIDPFVGISGGAKCGLGNDPLWALDALSRLAYEPTRLLGAGLSDGPVALGDLEQGALDPLVAKRQSSALVSWGWAINLQDGDEVTVELAGPGGRLAHNRDVIDRAKAQQMLFAGKRRPDGGWPIGDYRAEFTVIRGGQSVIRALDRFEIR